MNKFKHVIAEYGPVFVVVLMAFFAILMCVDSIFDARELFDIYLGVNANALAVDDIESSYLHVIQHQYYTIALLVGIAGVSIFLSYLNSKYGKTVKLNAQKLEIANATLRRRYAAMEVGLDGILIVGSKGDLEYINKSFLRFLQVDSAEVQARLNKPWLEIIPQDIKTDIIMDAVSVIEHQDSWTGEYSLNDADDNTSYELSFKKLDDGGLVITNRDITDRQRMDKERAELQTQFYQAQKMEAIGRLAGGVAHDFNNILSAITGYTEFLIEDLEQLPDQRKFAQKIMLATDQAKKLVDQILTFSRKNDAFVERINLRKIVEENISMIEASAMPSVSIETDIDDDDIYIWGNSTQIAQTLMNLCVNAVDALDDHDGVLRIELKKIDHDTLENKNISIVDANDKSPAPVALEKGSQDGQSFMRMGHARSNKSYVCVTVSDTGTGMSYSLLERAFEPFFTTKPVSKGTGLGLSTVQGVIAQNNGALVLETLEGVGTRFLLFFPIDDGAVPVADEDDKDFMTYNLDDMRVLLVEDHKIVAETTQKMLQRMGANVIVAENGQEALTILQQRQHHHPFDLVLTDYAMPQMTGVELIAKCQKEFPDLKFMIASGYSKINLDDALDGYSSVKAILKKPLKSDVLREKIVMLLTHHEDEDIVFIDDVGKT